MNRRQLVNFGITLLVAVSAGVCILAWGAILLCWFQSELRRGRGLEDEDAIVRLEAVAALGQRSVEKQEPDPRLIAALKDPDADVRLTAAEWLGEVGLGYKDDGPPAPRAMRALPALISILKDRHAGVRKEAVGSILRIVGGRASCRSSHFGRMALVDALCKGLTDEDPLVRCNVCRALGLMELSRSEARVAVRALKRALKDHSGKVRQAAAEALKPLLPAGKAQP